MEDGRHPTVEQGLLNLGRNFIPNSVHLSSSSEQASPSPGRLHFITGPNMSGKSSLLRQTALIAILAQVGSFVPCNICPNRCSRRTLLSSRRERRPLPRSKYVHGRNARDCRDSSPRDGEELGHYGRGGSGHYDEGRHGDCVCDARLFEQHQEVPSLVLLLTSMKWRICLGMIWTVKVAASRAQRSRMSASTVRMSLNLR